MGRPVQNSSISGVQSCIVTWYSLLTLDVLIKRTLVGEAVEEEGERDDGELCDDERVAERVPGEPDQLVAHDAAEGEPGAGAQEEPEEKL